MIDFNQKTVLFGGSFDPFHNGHLNIAISAKKLFLDSQVVLVPTSQSPGKPQPAASKEDRLAWLILVAKEHNLIVWDYELNKGGNSYSIDTLKEACRLGADKENLYMLVGADSYNSLQTWKDALQIRNYCKVIVGARPGHEVCLDEPTDIILPLAEIACSSTQIRASIAAGKVPTEFLPPSIAASIKDILLTRNPYGRN